MADVLPGQHALIIVRGGASPSASYITAQTLTVDGGNLMS